MKVYTLIFAVFTFMATLPEAGAWAFSRRTTDCSVTSWSEWSTHAGSGTVTRERAILRHPSGGGTPCPALKETKYSNCSVTQWSEWSIPVGFGTVTRERVILRHTSGGGAPCPALKETKEINCSVSSWSEWSTPEGFGTVTRDRSIWRHPSGGGAPCPALKETKEINELPTQKQTAVSLITKFIRERVVEQNFGIEAMYSSRIGGQSVESPVTGPVRDLLIIVDSSGSIGSENFTIAKDQLSRMLGLFCPGPDPFRLNKPYHRVALLQYSEDVSEEFDFDDKTGLPEIQTSIKNMKYMDWTTCTAYAFKKAQTMFSIKKGMRNDDQLNVVREVLILTDGVSTGCGSVSAVQAAMDLKNDLSINVTVFGLAIGQFSQDGQQELQSYVSDPPPQHVFAFPDFRSLAAVVGEIETQLQYSFRCQRFD